jgi:hypothetical protein
MHTRIQSQPEHFTVWHHLTSLECSLVPSVVHILVFLLNILDAQGQDIRNLQFHPCHWVALAKSLGMSGIPRKVCVNKEMFKWGFSTIRYRSIYRTVPYSQKCSLLLTSFAAEWSPPPWKNPRSNHKCPVLGTVCKTPERIFTSSAPVWELEKLQKVASFPV